MTPDDPCRITPALLHAVIRGRYGPHGEQEAIIRDAGVTLGELQEEFGLTTPLRVAHFVAQIAHESDTFATATEYATGQRYEGRSDLGNAEPGDGPRFKGRGLIQVTGRANYAAFSRWATARNPMAPDYLLSPQMVRLMPAAALSALWYWQIRDINRLADQDDLVAVTRAINGGANGLADRRALLAEAKGALAGRRAARIPAVTGGVSRDVLRRGSDGPWVPVLQRALVELGHGPLQIDGYFGPATEVAVVRFQVVAGLMPDGIVGPRTWARLGTLTTIGETP